MYSDSGSLALNRCWELHCICTLTSTQGIFISGYVRFLSHFAIDIPLALFTLPFLALALLQGIILIYIVVPLVRKAYRRTLVASIPTSIFVLVCLLSLFRILEIAIDPQSFLNAISLGARACLFFLVIFLLLLLQLRKEFPKELTSFSCRASFFGYLGYVVISISWSVFEILFAS